MVAIRNFLILCSLLLAAGHSAAASYCVNDALYNDPETCFATFAEAEKYLYSDRGDSDYLDADASLYVPDGIELVKLSSGAIRKVFHYRLRTVAPTLPPELWFPVGAGFCEDNPYPVYNRPGAGCATHELAYQGAVAFFGGGNFELQGTTPLNDLQSTSGWVLEPREVFVEVVAHEWYENTLTPVQHFNLYQVKYWRCPDTHKYDGGDTLGRACEPWALPARINVDEEPIKLAKSCKVGNPCSPQTGIKTQEEVDFSWEGLSFSRLYHSSSEAPTSALFGPGWLHSLDVTLNVTSTGEVLTRIGADYELYRKNPSTSHYYSLNEPGTRVRFLSPGALLERPDGTVMTFQSSSGHYALIKITLPTGMEYSIEYCGSNDDRSCAEGQIKTVRSVTGRALHFVYADAFGTTGQITGNRLFSISDDSAALVTYAFDDQGWLRSATYAGTPSTSKVYAYNETGYVCVNESGMPASPCHLGGLKPFLTSITDESQSVFARFRYDNFGRVVTSEHAGAVKKYAFGYVTPTSTSVSSPNGSFRTYNSSAGRFFKPTSIVDSVAQQSSTYDLAGFLDQVTDRLGIVTDFDRDVDGRLTKVTSAKGKAYEQVSSVQWHGSFNLPTQIDRAGQRIILSYNSRAQLLSATLVDLSITPNSTRVTSYVYCEQSDVDQGNCPRVGLLTSVNGPLAGNLDVTRFVYRSIDHSACATTPASCQFRKGDLYQVINALGQVKTHKSYDVAGRLLSVTGIDGVSTDLEYSQRGWLSAMKVRGADNSTEADDAITRIEYYATGLVKRVVQPDASSTQFSYDAAHRLTDVTDALGNSIHYTLNAAGDRVQEDTKNDASSVKHSVARAFDTFGRVQNVLDGANGLTQFSYDDRGRLDLLTNPLSRVNDTDVDGLGRVIKKIVNSLGSGAEKATSEFQYDGRDNLTQVKDPKGLITGYSYNGFDELTQLVSPDTGSTAYGYDAAGSLITHTDARGVATEFAYDLLRRITLSDVPTAGQDVMLTWDTYPADCTSGAEQFSKGRLARITDESGSTRYCYDRFGNLVRKVQTIIGGSTLTTGATYNAAGNLVAMTYPSGAIVTYLRDGNGRATGVSAIPSIGANQVTLVSNLTYAPFGPVTSTTYGNGRVLARTYDQAYRPDAINSSGVGGLSEDYSLDSNGNVIGLIERGALARTYEYDGQERLKNMKDNGSIAEAFTYDATGNRTSKTVGAATNAYAYPATSHRLTNVANQGNRIYDNAGNTTLVNTGAPVIYTYDDRGRMRTVTFNGTLQRNYRYNGRGERVLRIVEAGSGQSLQFLYDEAGHLLGEYNTSGGRVAEYVWVDNVLVGVMRPHDGTTYQYVETDHLGTPRAVVNPLTNATIWRWDMATTTFGDHLPNSDPDGNAIAYPFNLRYPGQYYDGLEYVYYNYYRDYDARTGRYMESDPIGQAGGVGTYNYAGANPNVAIDPLGLFCVSAKGLTYCNHPDGPAFVLPTPPEFPERIDGDELTYHQYDVRRPIGCADPTQVLFKLIAHPTPGDPKPASPQGTPNNAVVAGLDNHVVSYLTMDLESGRVIAVNLIGDTGLFGPGYVIRDVADGVAHTYGEGTDWKQSRRLWGHPAQEAGNQVVWGQQMEKLIEECVCMGQP